MSVFQSFQTGLALGQEQRKQRDMDTARKGAAEAYKLGNFEGATSGLMAAGLYDEADAYGRAGERVKAEKKRETYGEAFKTGGWTALGEMAGAEGDFETAGLAQQQVRAKTLQDWEDRDRKITEQKQGVEFLATSAAQIRSLPLEARGQAALDAIARSPFAQDQNVIQAVQQAAADGRITDEELTAFEEQMLTYAQRLEGQRWQQGFDREGQWREEDVEFRNSQARQAQENWQAEFDASTAAAVPKNPAGLTEDQIKLEVDLSNRWMPIQNNFADIQQQYARVSVLGADVGPDGQPISSAQRAVNDLALVVAFTKMLDPGSVAREGEVELTKKSASLLGEAQTWLPRLEKGGTLLPAETRRALVEAAQDMMPAYERAYHKLATDNTNRITDYSLSPQRVMLGYDPPAQKEDWSFKGGSFERKIPQDALIEFYNDRAPDADQEFDAAFGQGAAEWARLQRAKQASGMRR